MSPWTLRALAFVAFSTVGCERQLVGDLAEDEANQLIAALGHHGVAATKVAGGGAFSVEVDRADLDAAWFIARQLSYPRDKPSAARRLVVGPSEVAADARRQQQRSLQRMLAAAPGVIDAQIVLSDSQASVVVHAHDPSAVDRASIQAMVAAGADLASPARVVVDVAQLVPPPKQGLTGESSAALIATSVALIVVAFIAALLLLRVRALRGQRT